MSIRFTQSCPTCGRRIQIQASLMGHSVACSHCHAEFTAVGGDTGEPINTGEPIKAAEPIVAKIHSGHSSIDPLMARVEKALARASEEQTAIG